MKQHLMGRLFAVAAAVLFANVALADATTINFISPLLVTALSILLLREDVGVRRWAAVVAGLVGVVIVIRPGSGTFGATALLPIASASCWALGIVMTRRLAGVDGPWTAMCYMAIVGVMVFCSTVLFPLVEMAALLYLLLPMRRGVVPPGFNAVLRAIQLVRPWGMIEVFMLGILVTIVKMVSLARVVPEAALFAFGALTLMIAVVLMFDPRTLWDIADDLRAGRSPAAPDDAAPLPEAARR